ncbi:hypothetical protein A1QG_13700 [Vibrio breoganii ZF-29]|nr:hypothetical protein A1QG_13700 [Vibrio breoganii ZF-29]PML12045.1 hypothetical protein BCT84_15965 [Vibrio breoganii]PML54017.1 hypothetical protein BCT73_17035 [Vibrio breoganii]PMO80138.1 hypothetical protein BCT00_15340 [Vibrio breoganii]
MLSDAQQQQKSALQVRLLKGPLYRAKHKELWQWLERDQMAIRAYFQQIGLSLLLDEMEGYAFLKQQDESEGQEIDIPRLISRRSLNFHQTLLLVLLRKRLAEHDSEESASRLIVERSDIYQWLTPFYPEASNEVKQRREFDVLIKKIIDMGFLSTLSSHPDAFEVQRILKAVISAEQISELIEMLGQYQQERE